MNITKTGFCWKCGLQCEDLFCNDTCEKRYVKSRKTKVKSIYADNLWTTFKERPTKLRNALNTEGER
jgi:hypothetical protein